LVVAKLAPLAELNSLDGINYVYDPGKITALYALNRIVPGPGPGPLAQHVYGITTNPIPIGGTAAAFLASLKIQDKFATFTGSNGSMYVLATAITMLLAHHAGVTDANVKCVVFLGSQIFQVREDVPTVRGLINAIRAKPSLDGEVNIRRDQGPSKASAKRGTPAKIAKAGRAPTQS
jgi:hypothetical protein